MANAFTPEYLFVCDEDDDDVDDDDDGYRNDDIEYTLTFPSNVSASLANFAVEAASTSSSSPAIGSGRRRDSSFSASEAEAEAEEDHAMRQMARAREEGRREVLRVPSRGRDDGILPNEPVVVLLGWTGCDERQLAVYGSGKKDRQTDRNIDEPNDRETNLHLQKRWEKRNRQTD